MNVMPVVSGASDLVLFRLDSRPFALAADAVVEVLAAVAVRPLPGQPRYVAGVIDLRGAVTPVVDLRVRLGGTARAMELSDRLIVVRAGARTIALWVDVVDALAAQPGSWTGSERLMAGDRSLSGVVTTAGGLTAIHDAAAFIAQCETDAVFEAAAG